MGKFAIECPKCGNYVTAYNGLRGLVQNRITCKCGCEIDVRTERMASAVCPHCGSAVIYDGGKHTPRCPVCKKEIGPAAGQQAVLFQCPECGVGLSAPKDAQAYTCPICDHRIDVQREAAKDRYARAGLAGILKYEGGGNTFVWKHPIEDFYTGTQLIVHETQEALFFRDGQALDLFGPGRYTLETQNLPLMDQVYRLPTGDTRAVFHTEVYFINLATQMGIKWGTDSKIRIFDPMSGMHVSIGASGQFNLRVSDSRRVVLKLVGTSNGLVLEPDRQGEGFSSDLPAMTNYFRSLIMTSVKSNLAAAIKQQSISILEIDEHLEALSAVLREKINEGLAEYGLTMPEFYIMRVVTPEDDPDDPNHRPYMEMKALFARRYLGVEQERVGKATAEAARERILTQAQTEAQTRIIGAQAEAEAYRLQAEAEAEAMRRKGYTYQQETARQVGMEAMKNGLSGGDGLGGVAGLGVALGAMGSVAGMTREALDPGTQTPAGAAAGWDCACGAREIRGNFCPNCGAKRPEPKPAPSWDCSCGQTGNTGNFCTNCGAPKPGGAWDCPCGQRGNTGNFCANCGRKRGE